MTNDSMTNSKYLFYNRYEAVGYPCGPVVGEIWDRYHIRRNQDLDEVERSCSEKPANESNRIIPYNNSFLSEALCFMLPSKVLIRH